MGDGDCHQRGRDRQDAEHHAAMRSVDRLHTERHQQRKKDADANHCDHELFPQRARRKWPAQHKKQHQEHRPAIAVRIAVSAIGSMAETASRVAGRVPPKITMPIKPSNRPSCCA